MPLIPFKRRIHGVLFLSAALPFSFMGCSQSVEESKAFQAEVSRVDRIDEEHRASLAQLAELESQVTELSTGLTTLRQTGGVPGNEEALKALEQRLIRLETQIGSQAQTVALKTKPDAEAPAAEAAPAAVPEPAVPAEAGDAAPPAAQPEAASAKLTVQKSKAKRTEASRREAKKTEKPKAAGFYHKVKAGDNLNTIAAQYSIPLGSLQEANKVLTNGKQLAAGQMVYVPAKR